MLAWKNNVSLAFGADCGFTRSTCGYVGSSDGFQDISAHMKMTWNFWNIYCDEAYAVLSPDWIGQAKLAPSGFDLAALEADLAAVRG